MYQPQNPYAYRPDVNNRDRRQGRRVKLIYFSLIAAIAASWFLTPLPSWVASFLVSQIPISDDISIGQSARQHTHYHVINDYGTLNSMGMTMVSALSVQVPSINTYDWKFELINEPYVNAFAFPGGRIYVTQQLWELASEAEIYAVLGHEIGHVLHRHSQQRVVQQKLGSLVINLVLRGFGEGAQQTYGKGLGDLLAQNAEAFSRLSYSRANEFEADAVAFWASVSANIDPTAAASFFKKLDGGEQATSWQSTHPGSKDRIQKLLDKQTLLETERRRGGSDSFASMFKPSTIPIDGDSSQFGGSGSFGALNVVFNIWNQVPQHIQIAAVMEGLRTAAVYIDSFIDIVSDMDRGGRQEDGYREADDVTLCEDGESKISFERVRPGYFLHLGFGHCLSVEDLSNMARSSLGVNKNPYTQQPFTPQQKSKIAVLLRGGRLR